MFCALAPGILCICWPVDGAGGTRIREQASEGDKTRGGEGNGGLVSVWWGKSSSFPLATAR